MQRRTVLQSVGMAAGLAGIGRQAGFAASLKALPPVELLAKNAEAYWKQIRREQFSLPEWRYFLNNGSLGVAPRRVVAAVSQYLEDAATLVSDEYPRWGYETLDEERSELAEFVGCKKDELAITHNATEGLSCIAEGLDLKPGDEVVMTDNEHVSGKSPWYRRAQRDGIVVKEVKLPLPPKDSAQLADLMISAIGPKTKVLFFSGIVTTTGLIMPMKELCAAARAKGIISIVDGAHVHGQIPLRIDSIGCDYFVGSPHKWMFAPAGSGFLYIREENLERLWPTIVTGDWDTRSLKAGRFMRFGTNNRAIVAGMIAGLRFLKELGPERVYSRIHELAKLNYKMASERPYIKLLSGADDRLYGSLVTVLFPGKDMAPLWKKLKEQRVWCLTSDRLRLSTHIHTRPQDLEKFYSITDELWKRA